MTIAAISSASAFAQPPDNSSRQAFGQLVNALSSGNLDAAIADCQKALTYDAQDPFAHYQLGLAFMNKANKTNSLAELDPALKHFQQMLDLNPDMAEAAFARGNIALIQKVLQQQH